MQKPLFSGRSSDNIGAISRRKNKEEIAKKWFINEQFRIKLNKNSPKKHENINELTR